MMSTRTLRLVSPSLAAVVLRGAQLLVLLVLTSVSTGQVAALVASFGVISAFAVLSDSGAAAWLLSADRGQLTRPVLKQVLGLHLVIGASGAALAFSACWISFPEIRSESLAWVVGALALTPCVDSSVRVVRTPWLLRSEDHRFAAFDLWLAFMKTLVVAGAFAFDDVSALIAMPAASVIVLAAAWRSGMSTVPRGDRVNGLATQVLVFGANGAASTLYSQSPMILAGFMLSTPAVALLALCYRISQPLELIPATLGQQCVPRFKAEGLSLRKTRAAFVLLGLLASLGLVAFWPVIEHVFGIAIHPGVVFLLIAGALPAKFLNYANAAYMFANGMIRRKLLTTIIVGLLSVGAAAAAASHESVIGTASVSLLSELLLAILLAGDIRRSAAISRVGAARPSFDSRWR